MVGRNLVDTCTDNADCVSNYMAKGDAEEEENSDDVNVDVGKDDVEVDRDYDGDAGEVCDDMADTPPHEILASAGDQMDAEAGGRVIPLDFAEKLFAAHQS